MSPIDCGNLLQCVQYITDIIIRERPILGVWAWATADPDAGTIGYPVVGAPGESHPPPYLPRKPVVLLYAQITRDMAFTQSPHAYSACRYRHPAIAKRHQFPKCAATFSMAARRAVMPALIRSSTSSRTSGGASSGRPASKGGWGAYSRPSCII